MSGMMIQESRKNREQIQIMSLDDLVPKDHLVRKLEAALDWNFVYEMVAEKYSKESGRPSIDPVVLIKLPVIQYMFRLRSMRQTIREAEVNRAYSATSNRLKYKQIGVTYDKIGAREMSETSGKGLHLRVRSGYIRTTASGG